MHAEELARFEALVVRGRGADDCAIWKGAIEPHDVVAREREQYRRLIATINLGLPAFRDIAGRTALLPERPTTPRSC